MMKTYNIPAFLKYLNINASNSDMLQVIFYDEHPGIRMQSAPVGIDFYLLALKDKIEVQSPLEEMSDSYLFLDKPGNTIEWDLARPFEGFAIFINAKLLSRVLKDASFADYNRHEALFLTVEEKETLYDLFKKAFTEYQKKNFSTEVLVSYTMLIFIMSVSLKPGATYTTELLPTFTNNWTIILISPMEYQSCLP